MAAMRGHCDADYECLLTDEHPACPQGAPVVVSVDYGTVFGPAEAGVVRVGLLGPYDTEAVRLIEAARRAGYDVRY